ncbi:hypothetical protein J2X11_000325 [Aeromicrobium panaciterrae]|uniref:DUF3558 domain-containing protein n=1 Tax=Aeromicrobium panaciterrae TaxID=363861 RepID=A0ABU1UJY4_9ACTN|nr:hypothetical protein [Aeromicrobium panaciterrae]MDR7085486.1 hypothetical protein [Aeromicrobium panaciterrae]
MILSRVFVVLIAVSTLTLTACGSDTKDTGGSGDDTSQASDDKGACSSIPSEADVESIIGAKVLPVEDQGTVGCAYVGDDNNVGVYFLIDTDQFDIDNYANPDPQYATMLDNPELPAGSYVQSGDLYAKKGDVLYKVVANVNGTVDDDQLATELMVAWLKLV